MSDDGAKDTGEDEERPSRPETAAGRRARRRGADDADSVREPVKAGARGAGSSPAKRKDSAGPGGRGDDEEKKLPIHKRVVRYLRQVVDELRKVIWPTRKQMVTYTIVVLAFVAFMVGLVALLDWVFGKAVFALFG